MTLESNDVFVTFDLVAENDLFDSRDVNVEFETYGPTFRDDCCHRTTSQIDAKILKEIEDSGELDQMLGEMEYDSLELTFERQTLNRPVNPR